MSDPITIYKKTLNEKFQYYHHNGLMKGLIQGFVLGVLISLVVYLSLSLDFTPA